MESLIVIRSIQFVFQCSTTNQSTQSSCRRSICSCNPKTNPSCIGPIRNPSLFYSPHRTFYNSVHHRSTHRVCSEHLRTGSSRGNALRHSIRRQSNDRSPVSCTCGFCGYSRIHDCSHCPWNSCGINTSTLLPSSSNRHHSDYPCCSNRRCGLYLHRLHRNRCHHKWEHPYHQHTSCARSSHSSTFHHGCTAYHFRAFWCIGEIWYHTNGESCNPCLFDNRIRQEREGIGVWGVHRQRERCSSTRTKHQQWRKKTKESSSGLIKKCGKKALQRDCFL